MNKNLKKLLAFFAAAAMISPILPVSAEETELKDAVWYRNTFDNGAADVAAVDNDYLTLRLGVKADGTIGAMPDQTVTVDGNVGVRVRQGAWLDGQTLLFNPKTAISEGKYRHGGRKHSGTRIRRKRWGCIKSYGSGQGLPF